MPLIKLAHFPETALESLLDLAFGEDRKIRTAYRVRLGMECIDSLSFGAADADDKLVGSIQCWPVQMQLDGGGSYDMIMLGPVAVLPELQAQGIGKSLMAASMSAHAKLEHSAQLPLMMIGDEPYYGRWGFSAKKTKQWRLEGTFEQDRLLCSNPARKPLPKSGLIGPVR